MTPTLRDTCLAALLAIALLTPASAALAAGPPPPPVITSLKATHPHKYLQKQPGTSGAWIYYGHADNSDSSHNDSDSHKGSDDDWDHKGSDDGGITAPSG
ncbi:hypothetical protein K7B10_00205 [Streptomyces flavotricini]|uniref:Uncharacterized protein n=1 Tax=Streptomyces flavotricini TaxID=66888 RepID=A0ABS8DWR9_9ACTN|nr:hypothetical protein [Streptomyces flavotricini]MCC0093256.1 hypothetical protein [Streptomyces flavotricini]